MFPIVCLLLRRILLGTEAMHVQTKAKKALEILGRKLVCVVYVCARFDKSEGSLE